MQQSTVDGGYVRTAVKPAKDATEQSSYATFAAVIAKQPEGNSAFVNDADSTMPAGSYDGAKRVGGLEFDD